MWGKPLEATRLIALRKNALEARGSQPIFTVGIRLTLRVHVGFEFAKQFGDPGNFGDLDTFVSGVCDGLMKAHPHPATKIDPLFTVPENSAVHPSKPIAIEDDSKVTKIDAEKIVGPGNHGWYEILLEGE